ncbi:SGNH/GDSL hydrolase family protein, partial [Klebsiella quasipneumoniae]|nr:SGNH/GDSL hydrolase family protein [Klebsiella quasipneumoniae]
MAFNPELGSTSPAVLLDNAERLDKLVNGPAADVPDRGGDPLYSWRQMMAKNDEVRQNLIPLSRQYTTLADAQADIANIPVNSFTYVRDPSGNALALEYQNVAGVLTATGRKMPSRSSMVIGIVDSWVNNNLYPFDSLSSPNENSVSMNVAAVSTIAYREAYSALLSPVAVGDIITVRYKYNG